MSLLPIATMVINFVVKEWFQFTRQVCIAWHQAQERVKQQGRTTRSECGHSSPSYLSLWRQAITLASPLNGHGQRKTAKDGCSDRLSAKERLAPVVVDAVAVLSARERLAPAAVIGTDEGTDDNGWQDGWMERTTGHHRKRTKPRILYK
jgi:hypothetical protein